MAKPLKFGRCRELGAGLPMGMPGFQLELRRKRAAEVIPLNGQCFHCDRRAKMYVRQEGKLVGLCTWHLAGRLPLGVRKSAFAHLRKVGT